MKFRTLLLGLSALFVAFNAAFFSVSGLSKLFAGAALSVIVMASSLEFAKLITAGYLYNYWEKINKVFRIYLSIGVIILVLITSLGIYGFLTAAFQDTLNQYNVSSKQKAFLQQKESFWGSDVARYDNELERISENIATLSNAKSSGIQVRDTTSSTGFRNTISTTELRLSQKRIEVEETNRRGVQSKREVAADSLQRIQLRILELDTDTETGSELGPLQYLSNLLDKPMTDIINWFILIIIFVFDPLAVALVIAFNNALKVDKGEKDKKKVVQKRELYGEDPDLWDDTLQDGLSEISYDDSDPKELEPLDTTKLSVFDEPISNVFPEKKIIEDEDKDAKIESLEETLDNVLDDIPYEVNQFETYLNDIDVVYEEVVAEAPINLDLDIDGDGTITDEERSIDLDGDGKISEEELRIQYENGGWKQPYKGTPYYLHPWFDWKKIKRWRNDRVAVNFWLKFRGGTQTELDTLKSKYPSDFNSKTY